MQHNIVYNEAISGEILIIYEEIERLYHAPYTAKLDVSPFLDSVMLPLDSIERKTGTSSIDYINISTLIVDVISNIIIVYTNILDLEVSSNHLYSAETANYFVNQKDNLIEALRICRKLEDMNIDYAYRIKKFNTLKMSIERQCKEYGIDTRTPSQKRIDQLKAARETTVTAVKDTAGCAMELVIKAAIIIGVLLLLMGIVGK